MSLARRRRVLAILPGIFPSTVVNVAKPLMQLHAAGAIELDLTLQFVVGRRQLARADLVVMTHTIDPACAGVLDDARALGKPILYDIDENLLEVPDEPGLAFHKEPARQAAVRRLLRQAALVRTYSPVLHRYLEPLASKVVRVDGPVDWQLLPAIGAGPAAASSAGRAHVVYATSRVPDSIGPMLVEPLQRVLERHAGAEVTIWGPRLPGLDGHPRVSHRDLVRDYDQYLAQFARAGFDVGLAPMPDSLFHQCKTATKFREYAACRIAGVYADTEMYRDCVVDGATGLLSGPSTGAWAAAIGRLIEDAALRRGIQDRAERYARERFSAGGVGFGWLQQIEEVASQAAAPGAAAARGGAPGSFARVGGIVRTGARSVSRVPGVLRRGGVRAVWMRTRAQAAAYRQLMEWELKLRK
ncbi:MAG: glycosyltransferase [Acidobacteria bacterium]|nr:glycosyltransferase [Acidobacteriota bacterium]